MIRDVVRLACVCAGMAVASSLIIETRFQLASIDTAHRYAVSASPVSPQPVAATPPGRLRAFGRAFLDLADAGLGVVR